MLLMDLKVTEILKSLDRWVQNIDQLKHQQKQNGISEMLAFKKNFFSGLKKFFQPSFLQTRICPR